MWRRYERTNEQSLIGKSCAVEDKKEKTAVALGEVAVLSGT